jgi:O-methyltransferase
VQPARRLGYQAYRGINRALGRANIAVETVGRKRIADERRLDDVRELHEWLRTAVLVGLEPKEGRIELLARLLGTSTSEGVFIAHALQRSLPSGGDVCEFGVAQGATSALIANEIRATDRTLWLFDSFEGLSRPSEQDVLLDDTGGLGSMAAYEGAMAHGPERVRERLAEIGFPAERTRIVKGFVDRETTGPQMPERVAFAYLDMDLYEPTAAALDLVHERLGVGGRVVVDDFGFFTAGPERAVNAFLGEHAREYELTVPPRFAGAFCVLARVA